MVAVQQLTLTGESETERHAGASRGHNLCRLSVSNYASVSDNTAVDGAQARVGSRTREQKG